MAGFTEFGTDQEIVELIVPYSSFDEGKPGRGLRWSGILLDPAASISSSTLLRSTPQR
jgi:hypothetical protein